MDEFDPNLNKGQLKLANDMLNPTAQLGYLIKKAEKALVFHCSPDSEGKLDEAIALYTKDMLSHWADYPDFVDKNFPDLLSDAMYPDAVRTSIVEHYMLRDLIGHIERERFEFSFFAFIACSHIFRKNHESRWLKCSTDAQKIGWFRQFNSQFYTLVDCFFMIKEKDTEHKTKSRTNKKKAKARHAKSNKTKDEVIELAKHKKSTRAYKSRAQLAKELLKEAREIAKKNGMHATLDDDNFLITIQKWLSANEKAIK